jgi:hypothetical protein
MTAFVAINDGSFAPPPAGASDGAILSGLLASYRHLKNSITQIDHDQLVVATQEGIFAAHLPGGTTVSAALKAMSSRDVAAQLRQLLSKAKPFDLEKGEIAGVEAVRFGKVLFNQRFVAGIQAAYSVNGSSLSCGINDWNQHLRVTVRDASGAEASELIANVWQEDLDLYNKQTLQSSEVRVLPDYEDPGHHNYKGPNYQPGKSHIPSNALRILSAALPENRTTWWACCEHRFFHRYAGREVNEWPLVHWNGTTNPDATGNKNAVRTTVELVPISIRRILEKFPVDNCGCKEL